MRTPSNTSGLVQIVIKLFHYERKNSLSKNWYKTAIEYEYFKFMLNKCNSTAIRIIATKIQWKHLQYNFWYLINAMSCYYFQIVPFIMALSWLKVDITLGYYKSLLLRECFLMQITIASPMKPLSYVYDFFDRWNGT